MYTVDLSICMKLYEWLETGGKMSGNKIKSVVPVPTNRRWSGTGTHIT